MTACHIVVEPWHLGNFVSLIPAIYIFPSDNIILVRGSAVEKIQQYSMMKYAKFDSRVATDVPDRLVITHRLLILPHFIHNML